MPVEKRDFKSQAKLFIPTISEKTVRSNQRLLKKELDEVGKLKKELKKLIESNKKGK